MAKRAINAYVARRLDPLQQVVEHNASGTGAGEIPWEAGRGALQEEVPRTRAHWEQGSALEPCWARSTCSRDAATRSGRIRCLFLIHYMEAWDSVARTSSSQMGQAEDFEPIVASIPRRLPARPVPG